jgi:hypothetical protein
MNRGRTQWLTIGILVTSATAGVVLAVVTLAGMASPAAGDRLVQSSGPVGLTVAIAGSLVLLGLEFSRVRGRQARRRARLAPARRVFRP